MHKRSGVTFVEMALVLTLTTLIIGVLTVLYGFTMERLAHATADYAATDDAFLASNVIAQTVSDACTCSTATVSGVTGLKCIMPANGIDKDGDGYLDSYIASSVSRRGLEQFTQGKRIWFYLSDSTGTFGNSGTILWRAQRTDDLNPTVADRDTKFPYFSGTKLKYPLLVSASYTVNSGAQTVAITVTAGSLIRAARTPGTESSSMSYTHTETRTAFWRDWRK